ncbi:enoyl-[acyl-carrier-protein] reductase [NADH] 1, chloroplastic-like [Zingiber officinale]|uniref:enoyl-[acyl-carrier-protein] reductase [NADH] 1, chloroplastic-like n=1 Tax=Zingiber officinale TaxID=94328 RepID=UPI001C4B828D|nr:enoyl-[acyl-carrier-protein] reductase [NADH] 1, chloroplastic-like [Zingiber officinale]
MMVSCYNFSFELLFCLPASALSSNNESSGASISLTYIASERAIPGYEGGMSSAKAALESDTKVLAFELHLLATKHQVPSRVLGRMPTN